MVITNVYFCWRQNDEAKMFSAIFSNQKVSLFNEAESSRSRFTKTESLATKDTHQSVWLTEYVTESVFCCVVCVCVCVWTNNAQYLKKM